jgi:hypothetical protein
MSAARRALLSQIEVDRDRLGRFLEDFTRLDTFYPPGDAGASAAFISDFLH